MGVVRRIDSSVVQEHDGSKTCAKKTITWEELSKHNSEDDCWVAVDGKVYNITSWLPNHPGGRDLIVLSAGRDVTNLFESYHLMARDKPTKILPNYYVCDISTCELPKYTRKSEFYAVLKERVSNYFRERKADPQNSVEMWCRLTFVASLFIAVYSVGVFGPFQSTLSTFILALLLGATEFLFSTHIMHDACHAAITHNPTVWRWVGSTLDVFFGASYFAWLHQHVLGHHLYTNVHGADPDIGENEVDFRRIAPQQKWWWWHRYQHIYAPVVYGLLTFKYRFTDYETFFSRMNGQIRVVNIPTFYYVAYFVGKFALIMARIVIPLFYMSFGRMLLMFVVSSFASGYYLALVFQVSHIAHGLEFFTTPLQPNPAIDVEGDWAVMQVRTTQDYSHGNRLTTFLTAALNYQVIHHLFPSVSQGYYPQIAPIVKQTCDEYGVQYLVLPSFYDAFYSHISYMKHMGQPPADAQHEQAKKNM